MARQLLLLDLICILCFLDGSRFFKEPAGIVCHAFEAYSRGWCILLELEMISFFFLETFIYSNWICSPFRKISTFLSPFLKSANMEQGHISSLVLIRTSFLINPQFISVVFLVFVLVFSCFVSVFFGILSYLILLSTSVFVQKLS